MRRPEVDLRIEEMVVEGMSRRDAERVSRATRSGLERLLADRGLPEHVLRGGHDLRVPSARLEVTASTDPERLGSRISSAVHRAIRP